MVNVIDKLIFFKNKCRIEIIVANDNNAIGKCTNNGCNGMLFWYLELLVTYLETVERHLLSNIMGCNMLKN
jgi:hypothetical protein